MDNILYLGGGLLTVFVLGVFIRFNALMYMIIENANTHMNYWEKQINIISQNGNSIEVKGNDREIKLYVIPYNIIDTYEALKYLKNNNDDKKHIYNNILLLLSLLVILFSLFNNNLLHLK